MDELFLCEQGIRKWFARVIRQAVLDIRAGLPCSCGTRQRGSAPGLKCCDWDAHICAEDAARFLMSADCAALCKYLGIFYSNHMVEVALAASTVCTSVGYEFQWGNQQRFSRRRENREA